MTENEVIIALKAEIENQLALAGVTSFEVSRSAQPTDQFTGASVDSTVKTQVFLRPISPSENYNLSPGRKYSNTDPEVTYSHNKSMTIQIDVLTDFDYTDINALSAFDLCETVSQTLFEGDAIRALRDSGVRIQSKTDTRPAFPVLDKDRFESSPNFDLVVTYTTDRTKTFENITAVNGSTTIV
jgi:hypothetical protein